MKSIVESSPSVASLLLTDSLLGSLGSVSSGPGIVRADGTSVNCVPSAVQMPPESHAACGTSVKVTCSSPAGRQEEDAGVTSPSSVWAWTDESVAAVMDTDGVFCGSTRRIT